MSGDAGLRLSRIWLFESQDIPPKLHRWALRLMEYDIDLEWREGRKHHLPDALSRLPRFDQPEQGRH